HYREIAPDRRAEFIRTGLKAEDFFPHRMVYLPKCGPDGFLLAEHMCAERHLDRMWELVLYATPDVAGEFPRELFFDREIVWHQQHFGVAGQVASADMVER